jgi:Mg2+-importing ATPase
VEEEQRQQGFMATVARAWHRSPVMFKGLAASGDTLGEIARLAPEEALHRLLGTGEGLTSDEVEARLRSVGLNQITHQTRHTIVGELVSRSINLLNLLLLTLAAAFYLSGDQRVAIVIAVMVALSVSLGVIQEHRSNKAADSLRRMVLITATVRRKIPYTAKVHDEVPIEQLVPGDIVLLSAGHAWSDPTCTPRYLSPHGDRWFGGGR